MGEGDKLVLSAVAVAIINKDTRLTRDKKYKCLKKIQPCSCTVPLLRILSRPPGTFFFPLLSGLDGVFLGAIATANRKREKQISEHVYKHEANTVTTRITPHNSHFSWLSTIFSRYSSSCKTYFRERCFLTILDIRFLRRKEPRVVTISEHSKPITLIFNSHVYTLSWAHSLLVRPCDAGYVAWISVNHGCFQWSGWTRPTGSDQPREETATGGGK